MAVATGVFPTDLASQEALAAMRKSREALLAKLSRLQAEEERVIAKLDKIEEALAAVEAQISAAGKEKTGTDLSASSARANQSPVHLHHPHAAEHAAGGMSAAIKRSIGRAVESFAQEGSNQKPECAAQPQAAPEGGRPENAAKAAAKDGETAAKPAAARGRQGKSDKVEKHEKAAADNPFAGLQAALNAFDQTF